jgi:hypothetical protein
LPIGGLRGAAELALACHDSTGICYDLLTPFLCCAPQHQIQASLPARRTKQVPVLPSEQTAGEISPCLSSG